MVITTASLAIAAAMLLLLLYWIATRSLQKRETIFVALLIIVFLALCVGLAMRGWVTAGAWLLTALMLLTNFANVAWYGISTSSSAAYVIPILLAIFCLGPDAGWAVTIVGCILVFTIPILQSRQLIKTVLPFKISNLTFDAPVLTLIYLLVAVMANTWTAAAKNMILHS
jgi:hypothetical protein